MKITLRAMSAILVASGCAFAQDADVVPQHIHTIEREGDAFSGPGVDWVVDHARDAQFLVFGEQHNVHEIPAFVAHVQDQLDDAGYRYLALEMGPIAAETFSTTPFEEALGINAFAVAFDNDSDIALVERRLQSEAPGDEIWGLDQAFSSIHLLEALLALAPSDEAGDLVRRCLRTVQKERRDYIRNDHFDDIAQLRDHFNDVNEATRYIDTLETSMRMYTNWKRGQTGEPTLYLNLHERENYMKQRFMDQYRAALRAGEAEPKVIVKLGGAHVMPGIGPNRVVTFGTFAQEFARSMDNEALVVGIWTYETDPAEAPYDAWFADRKGVLIDCASLRPYGLLRQLGSLPEDIADLVYRYDAIVLLRGTERAAAKRLREYKSDKIRSLRDLPDN